MRRRNLYAWLGLVFLLWASATAGETAWIEVRTEHFSVITDAGEKNGRQVAVRFEQMREAYGLLFGRAKVNQPVPLQIIAFRTTKEVRQYSPVFRGKVVELGGFFLQGRDKDFVVVDMSRDNSWETVLHEYAHVLLNSNYPPTAPWFDEGFAEFFSSMKVTGTDVQLGSVIPEAAALVQGKKLGLLDLLQVEHHSETYYQNGQRRDMFYAESWLVVHYLFDTNQVSKVGRYFELTNKQKMPIPDAVQAAFGMSLGDLQKAILDYLRADTVRVKRYTFKEKLAATYDATVTAVDPLVVRVQLADLRLHSEADAGLAIKEYEQILSVNPNQAEAQRGLGYAYLRAQQPAKGYEHFQAAAKLGSKDARVYFYLAAVQEERDPGALNSPEVVRNLRHAIELDPQYADAYGMLGFSLLRSGNYSEAEVNLHRAAELSPRNEIYSLNYGVALMDQQKAAEAKAVFASLVHSSNPETAQRANEMLQQIEQYESQVKQTSPPTPEVKPSESAALVGHAPSPATPAPDTVRAPHAHPDTRRMVYLTGKLISVDCSSPPAATVTFLSGGKTYRLRIPDRDKVVLINAGKFACDWKGVKAYANYRDDGNLNGEIVSLELQF